MQMAHLFLGAHQNGIEDFSKAASLAHHLDDDDIGHFTPYKEVRRILLTRSLAQLSVNRLELGAQARQSSADKS
jgi:hypothetical protein